MENIQQQIKAYAEIDALIKDAESKLNMYGLKWKLEEFYEDALMKEFTEEEIETIFNVYKELAKQRINQTRVKIDHTTL
jgi:flavoprotein